MIKIFEFLVRKPGLTREQFNYHWLNVHGPLVTSIPEISRHLVRYCQNHLLADQALPLRAGGVECDGIVELWCESIDTVREMFGAPVNLGAVREDEHLFLDVGKGRLLVTEEVPVYERDDFEPTHGSIKLFGTVQRKGGMSRADCHRYWRDHHAPLVLGAEEFVGRARKYSQCLSVDAFDGNIPGARLDGVAEYWFGNSDDLWAAFTSRAYRERIQPDQANFQDDAGSAVAVAREILMYERPVQQ